MQKHFSDLSRLFLLISLILLNSCEKLWLEEEAENNPVAIFNDAWKMLDERYALFHIKGVDWQAIYHEYSPRISDEMTDTELFNVMGEMVLELRDGHTDLHSADNSEIVGYWPISKHYYNSFDIEVIKENYLQEPGLTENAIVSGKIDHVAYIHIASFRDNLSPELADRLMNLFTDAEYFIFDVRNNSGGNEAYGNNLIKLFSAGKIHNKTTYLKNGPGHDDFISRNSYLESGDQTHNYKKIVVLANRVTFSAANDFVSTFSLLPNVTIVGDTTLGGGGTPYYYELSNGWKIRYSSNNQVRPSDGLEIDRGIPPDIYVEMRKSSSSDNVLDSALQLFH